MIRFKNLGAACHAFYPAGHTDSVEVDAGGLLEVGGELTEELADAYLVSDGGIVRAWPKARWQLVVPEPRKAVKDKREPEAPAAEE